MPKISVIIPIYNVEKYLSQCIESVTTQTFNDIEVILINDGSTDNSGKICDEYAKKDSRLKVIHKENAGAAVARNTGIKEATGDYIVFIDSDDYWNDNSCLKEVNDILEEDSNIDVIMFDFIKYYVESGSYKCNNIKLDRSRVRNKTRVEVIRYLVSSQLLRTSAVCKVIKRRLLIDNKVFFQAGIVAEDIDWGLKVFSLANRFDVYDKQFYIYRQRAGSVTKTVNYKLVSDLWYVIKKWIVDIENGDYEYEFRDSILTYLAYHYSILMGTLTMVSEKDKWKIIKEMKQYKKILNYSQSKKTRLVKTMYTLIGFNLSMSILSAFLKLKKTFNF